MVAVRDVHGHGPFGVYFGHAERFGRTEGPQKLSSHDHELELTGAAYDRLVNAMATTRTPELLESGITMAQLKVLMLLSVVGEQRMSDLASHLGVSQSTASGLVERLVDGGLAQRRDDAADRRQVLISLTPAGRDFKERFQELGTGQLRQLLARLDTAELALVRQAIEVLLDAAATRHHEEDPQ